MKSHIHKILLILTLISCAAIAQEPVRYIYLDSPTHQYIDYLINSGRTAPDFVFNQPYDIKILAYSKTAPRGQRYFNKYWKFYYGDNEVSGQLQLSDRLNYHSAVFNRYQATGGVHFATPNVTLANRTRIDQDFKHDPNYAGDLSEAQDWLFGRVNDAYINLNYKGFELFYGRMHRNWGAINSPSLILSNNPYTYDHFLFSYRYKKLKISMIFARLEDLDSRTYVDPEEVISNARKYVVGHRLDIAFSEDFQMGFSEMATYGGKDRDIELAFFNPMNFYYGIQRNDNKQMNGFWAVDLFYKPLKQLILYGQLLIDDIIVNNEPGVDDRARFPDRLGVMFSSRTGDMLLRGLNLDLTYTRIWNRTYQSKFTWENYHYRELGLGYPCASCEEVKFKFGYWGLFPLYLSNEFTWGNYGDVRLTDLFPLKKEDFPIEPVTQNIINDFKLHYFYNTNFNAYIRMQYIKDKNHYVNRIDQYQGIVVSVGFEVLLSGYLNL
jgi:hypothetical protein